MAKLISPQSRPTLSRKQKVIPKFVIGIAILGALSMMFLSPAANTYTVVNTQDAGAGSLREAINAANTSPHAPIIEFDIPPSDPNYDAGTGVWTISLVSALPSLTRNEIQILGLSQALNQGDQNPGQIGRGRTSGDDSQALPQYFRPEIAINGGGASNVFTVEGAVSDLLIEGLAVYNGGVGINLSGGVGTNRQVKHCLLGVLGDGTDPGLAKPMSPEELLQASAVRWIDSIGMDSGNDFWVGILGNPVNDVIRMTYSSTAGEPLELRVLNVAGQLVYATTLEGSRERKAWQISTKEWAPGIYTLQMACGGQSRQEKVVVR